MSQASDVASAPYWRVSRPAVRRAMSLQDANPASATYGCCDRGFWQYRTIASFPAGTMQQLALPFAVLFGTAFPGNEWHQSGEMLDRARGAMVFWARSQHADGSVDEWYRNEHSYCATAFTTFGIAEALLQLQPHLAPADRDEIVRGVRRAAAWLAGRFNEAVMNQNLAAAAALWNVFCLTDDREVRAAFDATWRRTLAHQDEEGWFSEYGGADLGYSLLALDLLAALHRRGCDEAASAAGSLSRFIAAFVVGGSDLAGRLGSRGTEHSFPYGAEAFAASLPDCGAIASHLRRAIDDDAVSDPRTVDDRYLAYFYLPSFVSAAALPQGAPLDRPSTPRSATFARSGFRVWTGRGGDLVCSTRRGAAFALYAPGRPVHRNLGYWVETESGRRIATCAWSDRSTVVEERADYLVVQADGVVVDHELPLVRHEVAFRAAAQWLFRWPAIAEPFHRLIKRRKITRMVAAPLQFRRQLAWGDGELIVHDHLRSQQQDLALRAVTPTADIDVHSPSARVSGGATLDVVAVPRHTAERWAQRMNSTGELTLTTRYALDREGKLCLVGIFDGTPESAVGAPGSLVQPPG